MDIKSLSNSLISRPVATQASDLLAQLKSAGTLEAEVIKLLPGRLLLNSRLGEILTSNTLNFKPGDRLNIRLDTETQVPTLKVSPKSAQAVTLDARQNPELARVLPPDRAVLANVIRVLAQAAEIKIAEQILQLPRQAALAKGQLLSLRHNPLRDSIEINPLERKQIYKAILKQLIPQQSVNRSSALVKLLNLVNTALTEARPAPTAAEVTRLQSTRSPPATSMSTKPPRDNPLNKIEARHVTENQRPAAASSITSRQATATQLLAATESRPSRPGPNSAVLSSAGQNQTAALQRNDQSTSKTTVSRLLVNPAEFQIPTPVKIARPAVQSGTAKASMVDTTIRFNETTPASKKPGVSFHAKTATANIDSPISPIGREALVAPKTVIPPVVLSATTAPTPAVAETSLIPTSLQSLLQLVVKLPEIDVAKIRQLFELARLVRPTNTITASSNPLDPLKILQQLTDREFFSREMDQLLHANSKTPATSETAGAKHALQEALLLQIRDGIKLVEQALSHNLLQRASLGLQQETQQPLSFSMSLPFFDKQEVQTFRIDLAERNQSQEECNKSWDIRISFEFAELGPISCHIILEGQSVAASFYSEKIETRSQIEKALPQLRQQLIGAGFSPGEFHSFAGKLAQNQATATTPYSEALIDIEV